MVFLVDLEGKDEATLLRLLRALLKRLGRQFGVRCRAVSLQQSVRPQP